MFTRRVIMNIKPGSAAEAGRIFEDEIIPPLRGQKGMRHDDTFISPQLSEAVLNSYWDTQECAESYDRAAYPAALSALAEVLEGIPEVETFNVSSATFHQITAPRRATYRTSQLGKGVWPSAFVKPTLALGGQMPPASTHAKKRILKVGVYRPGDLTSEVTTLDDVNVCAEGDTALFTGHATVRSRFKGRDIGSLYQLSKTYEKQQGRWQVIASKTARLGDE
jgi:hypothetical protein